MNFEDILYEVRNGVAWITINRPDKMNAFRGQTCDEIIKALNKAGYDRGFAAGTIAAGNAIFGQVGPKMGSVDPGYGTAFLARVVGEKKAREIWYLNRRYSGADAVAMGLANFCFPHDELDAEVQKIGEELCERSPTALAIAKRSFNADTAHQAGIAGLGMYALKLYYDTEESREGVNALKEKRKPEFRKYVK